MSLTLNIRGRLMDLSAPQVMGIVNVTPDSFFAASRVAGGEVVARVCQMLDEGAAIIDMGACSTRPSSVPATEEEEWGRLAPALASVREALPEAVVSVDTFRATVARRSVREFNADIINDISGGEADKEMFEAVAELGVPYVLTHSREVAAAGEDALVAEVARYLSERLQRLYALGVADVILDPGFGFGKTMEQNFALLRRLPDLQKAFPGEALLVGISRKRMVWQLLGCTPDEALNGTTVLNTLALQGGAHLLRVHDVREAVEAMRLWKAMKN